MHHLVNCSFLFWVCVLFSLNATYSGTSADIMKVGGYKLSALEIESVLLEVRFYPSLPQFFLHQFSFLCFYLDLSLKKKNVKKKRSTGLVRTNDFIYIPLFCSTQLQKSVACWAYQTKIMEKLSLQLLCQKPKQRRGEKKSQDLL